MDKNDLAALLVGAPADEVDRIHRLLYEWSVGPDNCFPVQLALLTKAQWRVGKRMVPVIEVGAIPDDLVIIQPGGAELGLETFAEAAFGLGIDVDAFDGIHVNSWSVLMFLMFGRLKVFCFGNGGAVGMDDMKRLFDLARDARIVLSGDTGQHGSVARGDALRILEQHSDFKSGQLTRIRRQRKAEYRKAVELAAQKRTVEAFAQLERMGAVVESSKDDLHDKAAQAYLKALAHNQSALLVAPTWNEIEAVTDKIRAGMKASGRLTGEEKEFQVLDSLSWTEAQKRDARQYRPGMAIHFHRRIAEFVKDETVAVVGVENDALKVQRVDGSESIFPLGAGCACFDVGEKRKLKIAAGDRLLLQANASRKRFINGELVEVLAVQGDSVVLADGRVIPQHYRTFTHGYAVTSHAAQGKTVDEVLLVASSRSLPAINQQQFYVSISRGRDACRVFTDDAEMLRSHVTRSSARLAAVEVVPRVHSRKFIQKVLQRGHRFLKQFRQRRAPKQTILPDHHRQTMKPPRYEHQQKATHGIRL